MSLILRDIVAKDGKTSSEASCEDCGQYGPLICMTCSKREPSLSYLLEYYQVSSFEEILQLPNRMYLTSNSAICHSCLLNKRDSLANA
jgi:hypothetical protein